MRRGEIRKRLEARDDTLHVGRRPSAQRLEHGGRAGLRDHRLRIALAQGQHAQGEISRDLDGGAAEPEGNRETEVRIARDAGEQLHALGHEFLHQERRVARHGINLSQPRLERGISAREVLFALEPDGHEPMLGLVWDLVGDDFQYHRKADLARRRTGGSQAVHPALARDRYAVASEEPFGVELVDGPARRHRREEIA